MLTRTLPVLQSTRLLDQVRERARYIHYSVRTEKAYLYWVRFYVRWHGMKHPRDMGAPEVQAFLTMLASGRGVSLRRTTRRSVPCCSFIGKCLASTCRGCRT